MCRQLESWRSLLPKPLQWLDNDRFDCSDSATVTHAFTELPFPLREGTLPISREYNLDILNAQLRTRFYFARFLLYRPFVYKALHFPEMMSADDVSCCALGIQAACLWPLVMAPPKDKKRLIPHLFTWTHNSIGILLILFMAKHNKALQEICKGHVSDEELMATALLMLDWLKDMKQVDATADWAWTFLQRIFRGSVTVDAGTTEDAEKERAARPVPT
jgi:hypothetical protein